MFAVKSTLFLALLAVSAQLAVATPPACLLAAVNTESEPANPPVVCGSDASKVEAQIKKLCGSNVDAAMTALKSVCKGISTSSSSSSTAASSTAASSTAGSSTGSASGVAFATGSGSAASTGSSYAYSTGARFPIIYTSTYYDTVCSCTKTAQISSTGVSGGSTGFATGTVPGSTGTGIGGVSGPKSTGSPIAPTVSPSATSPNGPKFTGAASRNMGSFAAAAVAVAGLAVVL